ncbi:MAG: Hsp20/alpha crystallin family protein [Burkholderiales bacterium]
MQLTQWSPFREMEDFFNQIHRTFTSLPALSGSTGTTWAPLVDITETPKEYLVRAELPGMKKEDVSITIEEGVLTISGERRVEYSDEKRHRSERYYGRFERSFSIPSDVAPDRIDAEYQDGVLAVHLPRAEQKKPKAIEVKVH